MKQFIITLLIIVAVHNLQAQSITGRVLSSGGTAISRAHISLLNTSKVVLTDEDGNFSISGISAANYTMEISFIGYATQTKEAMVTKNKTTALTIILKDQTEQLNEAIVTSDRTETKLQQTPMAVSALSAKNLTEYRVWNITDLTALAPSFFTVEHGNSTSANFMNIRGVLGFGREQAVATYIDGVYQFELYSAPLNFNNIERVEILRGPQGTLYGRNAFGGVVNIITKKPTNSTSGFVETDFGNYGVQRYSAGINVPILKNRVFFNASAQYNKRGAIYSNPTLSSDDFDGRKSINANFNLKYLVSDDWIIDINAKTESNKDKGSYPWVTSDSIARNRPYVSFANWPNTEKRNNTNASVATRYYGAHFNFTSISAFNAFHIRYPDRYDLDNSAARLYSAKADNKQRQFTQEFRFSSPAAHNKLKWTAGTYLFANNVKRLSNTFYEEDYAVLDPDAPYTTIDYTIRKDKGIAFFGQVSYEIVSKLTFTVGTRYDVENKQTTETIDKENQNGTAIILPETADTKTFKSFTPKAVVSYILNPQSMLYASYAKGFRVGGFNIGSIDHDTRTYKPEKSENYEVAIKNDFFQNRLKLNVTAFYLQQKDQQVTTSTNGVNYLTLNAGDMHNFGIETEVSTIPFKNLQLEWNASFSQAEYAKLNLYDRASSSIINYKGNRPIYNPSFSSMTAVNYSIPLKNQKQDMAIFIRGEYRNIGKYYFDFENTQSQSAYGLINARAGLTSKNFEIALWGRNINDARYITWGTYGAYMLGSPHMYGLTLTGKF